MKQEASAPLAEVAVTDQHKKKKRKSKQVNSQCSYSLTSL